MSAAAANASKLAFGEFVLDRERRQVLRLTGESVALTPRLFNVLDLFVRRPGELIEKEQLMAQLWPGRVVEENSLSQVILGLRRALGDDGDRRRYIQTEARRGFRLVVPVVQLEPPAVAATTLAAMAPRSTLAVLPFLSITPGPMLALLQVGMADSLIARLSLVPGLVLRSIGSVRRYTGPDRDLAEAARALDAAWLLEGTLQMAEGQLRVSARLVSMPGGEASWSGTYRAAVAHVFDLQDSISEQVAQALTTAHVGQTARAPALAANHLGGTRNIDAYQLYLAAQQQAQRLRADSLSRSIELYRQALELDHGFALAHVGISDSSRRMIFGADREPREALDMARLHALAALKLAPDLAEAHAQLAYIAYWHDHDWDVAERTFRIALAFNANVAIAHFGLGYLLATVMGRRDEGLAHLRIAHELDPMFLMYQTTEAAMTADRGEVATGRARLHRILQIDPGCWIAHHALGTLALAEGNLEAALEAQRRAATHADGNSLPTAQLGVALARAGHTGEAREVLAGLEAIAAQRYMPPTLLAMVQAALGEKAAALEALELAYDVRDHRIVYLKDDRRWLPLRGAARFNALVQKLRLDRFGPGLNGP